jgi:hypothetical protein
VLETCVGRGRIERDAGGIDGEEGGGQVFMIVKKSGGAELRAPSLIGRLLNPRGSNRTTEITFSKFHNKPNLKKVLNQLTSLLLETAVAYSRNPLLSPRGRISASALLLDRAATPSKSELDTNDLYNMPSCGISRRNQWVWCHRNCECYIPAS